VGCSKGITNATQSDEAAHNVTIILGRAQTAAALGAIRLFWNADRHSLSTELTRVINLALPVQVQLPKHLGVESISRVLPPSKCPNLSRSIMVRLSFHYEVVSFSVP
jgi:hypothetical protein